MFNATRVGSPCSPYFLFLTSVIGADTAKVLQFARKLLRHRHYLDSLSFCCRNCLSCGKSTRRTRNNADKELDMALTVNAERDVRPRLSASAAEKLNCFRPGGVAGCSRNCNPLSYIRLRLAGIVQTACGSCNGRMVGKVRGRQKVSPRNGGRAANKAEIEAYLNWTVG